MKNELVIYAYTYPEHIDRPLVKGKIVVKIGDTTQGLDEGLTIDEAGKVRIDQQGNAAEAYKKVIIGTWGVDKSVINRDYVLHNKLQLEGRRPAYLDGKGQEWFELDGPIENVKGQIDNLIKSFGISANQKLKLREEQKRVLKETNKIIKETDSDKVHIAWSLPPRFGKTTSALKQFAESGKKVMILPSAWLSSHTSFKEDSEAFADFDDMIYIETNNNPNYKKTIDEALKNNQKVIVSVSLFAKDKRYFKPLKEIYNDDKFVVVDEGDHAAWTRKKRRILNYILDGKKHGKMILISMSGTNIARMVTGCDKLDGYVQSTYMALEKTQKDIVKRSYVKLQLDKTDKYVANLTEEDYFSYNKVIANPNKSSNFIIERTKALVGKNENKAYKNLNLHTIFNEDPNCIMEFVNGTKEQMVSYANIVRKALKDWRVEVLNSDYTSNKKAQDQIKTAIAEAKNQKLDGVWIVSNTMGSRSFSIPEIQATLISYDNGGMDPTIQKMSRSLTPGKLWNGKTKKTGYIITMSIDSNRDHTATDILSTEAAVQSQITGQPMPKVIKTLLNNVSILSTDEYGNMVELTPTDLQNEMTETETLRKVAYAMSRPDNILKDQILLDELLQLKVGGNKKQKESAQLPKAKNFISNKQKKLSLKKQKSIMNNVMKRIKLLCDSSSMVAFESEGKTFKDCISNFDKDKFLKLYGVESKSVLKLLKNNVLPEKLLDIIVDNTNKLIKSGDIIELHKLNTIGTFTDLGIMSNSNEKEVWKEQIKRDKNYLKKTYISMATNMGYEVAALLELGIPKSQIMIDENNNLGRVWENTNIKYYNNEENMNKVNIDDVVVIMNPPYGKNANLAIEMLNKAKEVSNKIIAILPKTIRKTGTFNRVDPYLHLVDDQSNPIDTFGRGLHTCTQRYEVRKTKRELISRYTPDMVKDDFEFTTKEKGQYCMPRVGRYGTGEIIPRDKDNGHKKNYDERSSGTTYYLNIKKPSVLKRLKECYAEFQQAARDVVGANSLGKDDLIRIYLKHKNNGVSYNIKKRTKEELEPYFEFTTKEKGDIALGRVGRGSTGLIYERGKDYGRRNNYEDRASGSHYFIKVKDKKVIKQLQDLEKEFRKVSLETVSNPSLSIDDIVNVYCEKYVG